MCTLCTIINRNKRTRSRSGFDMGFPLWWERYQTENKRLLVSNWFRDSISRSETNNTSWNSLSSLNRPSPLKCQFSTINLLLVFILSVVEQKKNTSLGVNPTLFRIVSITNNMMGKTSRERSSADWFNR